MSDQDYESVGTTFAPGKWQAWVTRQDRMWVNREGEVFRIDDLDGRYCLNIMRFVMRYHRGDLEGDPRKNPLMIALASVVLRDLGTKGALSIDEALKTQIDAQITRNDREEFEMFEDSDRSDEYRLMEDHG